MDSMNAPQPGARLNVEVAGSTAEVLFSSMHIEVGAAGHFARVSGSVSRFTKGTPTELKDIGFQVVNFNDFFTPGVYATPTFGSPPHAAELHHGGWRISLTAVPEFKEIFKSVGEAGGYAFTHLGSVERADGSLFSAGDADAVLDALRRFLSFARGAASSLPLRWGTAADGAAPSGSNGVGSPWIHGRAAIHGSMSTTAICCQNSLTPSRRPRLMPTLARRSAWPCTGIRTAISERAAWRGRSFWA